MAAKGKPKDLERVEVVWEDAWADATQTDFEEALVIEPCLRHTIGFLVRRTRKHIVLACTMDLGQAGVSAVADRSIIPRSLVRYEYTLVPYTPEVETIDGESTGSES